MSQLQKKSMNSTIRWAGLLIACVAVFFLYRWFHVVEDVNEQFSYSELQGNPAASGSSLEISSEVMRDQLKGVVKSQLTAFRDDDYVTAYTFAAAGIKAHYPLAAFERMVKTGYPAIAKFKSAEFGVVRDNGTEALVNVEVEGESGRVVHYQYLLRKEEGVWKISGVVEVKPKGTVA
jgi:ABC-type transporter MlaC component